MPREVDKVGREGLPSGEEEPGGGEEDVVGRRHAGRGHCVGRGTL
jgi:hypothetical protein